MKFDDLLNDFNTEIKAIRKRERSLIKQCNRSINLSRLVLSQMSQVISTSCFLDEALEIQFFKYVKSVPLVNLIHCTEVRLLERNFPKLGQDDKRKYLERKIRKINKFFKENIEFVSYVQNDHTHFDTIYFTRKHFKTMDLAIVNQYYRAPDFSTSHDFMFAKVKAYNLLITYVENRLHNISYPDSQVSNLDKKSNLKWTSSKVALTELIYALHSSGAINSGAVDIKELAKMSERFFNVELGDYYRTYLEIKMRKSSRTKFIDSLKNSLENKMDESDN